jgi:succinyl-CoA synthetase beta subunit/citryl-CoA synthetase large subunit
MRLLEFEAKQYLRKYGIPIPQGQVIAPMDEVNMNPPLMIKAQVPVGGRAKAGGVISAETLETAKKQIERLFGESIGGYYPQYLLLEEIVPLEHEFLLAVMYDTIAKTPLAVFSDKGGIDVENVTSSRGKHVWTRHFSVSRGLREYEARQMLVEASVTGKTLLGISRILTCLARLFLDTDATLAEINPLALTENGSLSALDCHLEIEDEALFRQQKAAEIRKLDNRIVGGRQSTEFEIKAREIDGLDHRGVAGRVIEFEGDLGLIIGGGGASLTAFDAIRAHGGKPANYCEIGGNPSVLKVTELTKHILDKPRVQKIAVIMNVVSNTRVDLVARGVIKGTLEKGLDPAKTIVVFRVPGAWEAEGDKILKKYDVSFSDRTVSIDQAAQIAVKRSGEGR